MLRNGVRSSALVWDSAPCHGTLPIKDKVDKLRITTISIPARLTGLLQPADVSWFRSFKQSFRRKYMDWFLHHSKSFTIYGNMRSPGYVKVIGWLSDIWRDFDET